MPNQKFWVSVYLKIIITAVLLLSLAGCAAHSSITPLTNNTSHASLEKDELALWRAADDIEEKIGKSSRDFDGKNQVTQYLREVINKITTDFNNPDIDLRLYIFRDTSPNAFVLPNGAIFVTTGLIALLENEAQMASVLSHEFQHFKNRHHIQQERKTNNAAITGGIVGLIAACAASQGTGSVDMSLARGSSNLWTLSVTSSFSQDLETEADLQGLERMLKADYAPDQSMKALELIQEFDKKNGNKKKTMFATHPRIAERIQSCKDLLKRPDINSIAVGNITDFENYFKMARPAILENARINIELRNMKAAEENIQKVLVAEPKCAAAYFLMGYMKWRESPQQELNDEVLKYYQKSILLDPDYALSYREMGLLFRYAGQNSRSREFLKKYLELAPDAADAVVIHSYVNSEN